MEGRKERWWSSYLRCTAWGGMRLPTVRGKAPHQNCLSLGIIFIGMFFLFIFLCISLIFTVNRAKLCNILNIKNIRLTKHVPVSNSTSVWKVYPKHSLSSLLSLFHLIPPPQKWRAVPSTVRRVFLWVLLPSLSLFSKCACVCARVHCVKLDMNGHSRHAPIIVKLKHWEEERCSLFTWSSWWGVRRRLRHLLCATHSAVIQLLLSWCLFKGWVFEREGKLPRSS